MDFQLLVDGDEKKMWRSISECIIEQAGSAFNVTLLWDGFKIASATEYTMEAAQEKAKEFMGSLKMPGKVKND